MNNDTLSHGSHHDIDIEPIDVEEEGTVREEASRRSSKENCLDCLGGVRDRNGYYGYYTSVAYINYNDVMI